MHIMLINFSGNVGKTTIARHLLSPRLNNAKIISVETISADAQQAVKMRGDEYGELHDEIILMDDTIVDVGASNVGDFITAMSDYGDAQENFDHYIVPVTPKVKQLDDTAATVEALSKMGIPSEKIIILRNMVRKDVDPMRGFESLADYIEGNKNCSMPQAAYILTNDIYDRLKASDVGITELINDKTDYVAEIRKAKTDDEKRVLIVKRGIRSLATGVHEEHERVFEALFGKKTTQKEKEVAA